MKVHLWMIAALTGLLVTLGWLGPTRAADGPVLPLPPEDAQEIATHLGDGVVGQALPSEPISDPLLYFPLQERSAGFVVTAGPKKGQTQTLTVAQRSRPTGALAWRAALSPSQAGFVQQNPTGDLMLPAVTDSDHDVVVISTPATHAPLEGDQAGENSHVQSKGLRELSR
jgi:hypothetical protein